MNSMSQNRIGYSNTPSEREVAEMHFENLYVNHYKKIYRLCRKYSPEPEDARDLAQEVFMRYFQNFENFRHEASPLTWMYKVAINLGIQRWRREKVRNVVEMDLDSIPSGYQDNEVLLLDRITVKKILGRCPEYLRKIIFMHHFERRTHSEIGRHFGVSRSTIIRHLIQFSVLANKPLAMAS